MAIRGTTEEELFRILNEELSASSPVTSPEHLFGREAALERVRTSLAMRGRQIFIHGDRGVGKTSLAQTAAFRFQSADSQPVITSCHKASTFESVMQDVIVKLRGGNPYESKRTLSSRLTRNLAAALPLSFLSVNATATKDTTSQTEEALLPHIRDANAAVTLLLHEDDRGLSKQPIVVIDEFDLMSTVERSHFADLLKQLGDQRVPIKFIFCGIGDTVDDLLEAHGSANRYFDGVKIERLNVSSRWDIIDKSATALGLSVDDEVRHRIAAISDGFPVYIHRICEKLYQTVFYDEEIVDVVGISHLDTAIVETIIAIEHFIRKPYDATLLRTDGETLELVLWALADHSDLTRTQRSIFDSYSKILERLSLPVLTQ
ncbi:AAA family ATPase [Pandoraea anhela]|nr:ATP-binding protein [Pandoraea anhela]